MLVLGVLFLGWDAAIIVFLFWSENVVAGVLRKLADRDVDIIDLRDELCCLGALRGKTTSASHSHQA